MTDYLVVKNSEDQYSIWPVDQDVPTGWEPMGAPRTRDACLDWIEENWTDMRPRSLREWMERQTAESADTARSADS